MLVIYWNYTEMNGHQNIKKKPCNIYLNDTIPSIKGYYKNFSEFYKNIITPSFY